jgi:hypothetical protein
VDTSSVLTLALLIFAAAVLYSSVGHAGASGYLAAMALFSVEPAIMKPTALVLNILVASGVGGGIFLSPLILVAGWAQPRETSGVSVTFILVNSIAGLLGQQLANVANLHGEVVYWGIAALAGGWIGSELGSRRLNTTWFRRLLSVVLVIAGLKLIFATG